MLSLNPTVYVLLFSVSLVITYIAVRRKWVRVPSAVVLGVMVNSMFFFLYSVARGNSFTHALTVGLVLGCLFSGLSVTMGAFFRNTVPVPAVARKQTQPVSTKTETI
jgi:hypothetical protein